MLVTLSDRASQPGNQDKVTNTGRETAARKTANQPFF